MPYNIIIQNEQGEPLRGTVHFFLEGVEIGEAGISPGGSTISDEEVEGADHYRIDADGYNWYGTSNLYDTSTFTLTKKPQTGLYIAVALVAGFAFSKLVKFKL